MQLPRITSKILKESDKLVRMAARRWLLLPCSSPDAFIHASLREGDLGVTSLRTLIPSTMRRRITSIAFTAELTTAATLALPYAEKLWRVKAYRSERFQEGYSGNGLNQGAGSSFSGCWRAEGISNSCWMLGMQSWYPSMPGKIPRSDPPTNSRRTPLMTRG